MIIMKAIEKDGQIKTYHQIPRSWGLTDGYDKLPTQKHYDDGWRDVVKPDFDANTEKIGAIYFDAQNDVFTYPVEALTDEEIKSIVLSNSDQEKQARLQVLTEQKIIEDMQAVTDVDVLLENAAIFPMWEVAKAFAIGDKVQAWDGNELKLYRTVQAHTSQSGWEPAITPALFTRVAHEGEILEWVQPTGQQDAYQIDDKVTHAGKTWISIAANNVWEPGVYGWNEI